MNNEIDSELKVPFLYQLQSACQSKDDFFLLKCFKVTTFQKSTIIIALQSYHTL